MNAIIIYLRHMYTMAGQLQQMYREITYYLYKNVYKTNQLLDHTRPQNCKKKNLLRKAYSKYY